MADIYKAAGIIIKGRKLLVVKSRGKPVYIAPGGKIEPGETAAESLVRELDEELTIKCELTDFEEFGTFTAEASNQPGKTVEMVVFTVKNYRGGPKASNEVEELRWITTSDIDKTPIGSIFAHEVMPKLKEKGLID